MQVKNRNVESGLTEEGQKLFINELDRVEEMLLSAGILTAGKHLDDFLQTNRLAGEGESVLDVFVRTTSCLADAGERFYGAEGVQEHRNLFLKHVSKFEIILGSPILTNAGRRMHKSVSACSIPPVKLSEMNHDQISKIVGDYHSRGMGTGFCLDDLENPVEMVKYLNHLAISEVQRGDIERSVGNMGVLSIEHPRVLEFIRVKTDNPTIKEWKFNLSINVTDRFMDAWHRDAPFILANGLAVNPRELMHQIAKDAHATGDPGLIFMDRINRLNKVPHMGEYKTVVPCGEVSLFDGEVCQFAYLNLAQFIQEHGHTSNTHEEMNLCSEIQPYDNGLQAFELGIKKESLRSAIHAIVILLDNAVEYNIKNMPNRQSAEIIAGLRRIGIGVCGFSEVLQALGLPYGSAKGRDFASILMSFINFESKCASVKLAKARGAFQFFDREETKRDLFIKPYKLESTDVVSSKDWEQLEQAFEKHGIRNLSTTILPPSGRSSLIAGVTASIEPPFRLAVNQTFKNALKKQCVIYGYMKELESVFEHVKKVGSIQETGLPEAVKDVFRAALEIQPEDHVCMAAAFQKHTDEGISKTVNLSHHATVEDVITVYSMAHRQQLKGITVYRDGCRNFQPRTMNIHSKSPAVVADPIYGPVRVSERMAALLDSPLLARLKGIHQNGTNYLVDSRQNTSRYEHSVGAMILAQKLGGNESMQVAALLHDVSHTAFSHVADIVFSNKEQNYHDLERDKFLNTQVALNAIKEFSITSEELACESIPLIKGKFLNVDCLDYCIRDLLRVNRIYHPQFSSILNNIIVDSDGVIKSKDISTARLIFNKFIEANVEIYFQPKAEAAAIVLSWILRQMLAKGDLSEGDLFTTDDQILSKINTSSFKSVLESIHSNLPFSITDESTGYSSVIRKLRYVDPAIYGREGRLTDYCEESKKKLADYFALPSTVHYRIPVLEKFYR